MRSVKAIILIVAAVTIAAVAIVGFALPGKSIAADIDGRLASIMKDLDKSASASMASSNPYDYVVDNANFEAIVALGLDALPILEQGLHATDADGLREYIMCIAIEEIARCDLKQFEEFAWDRAQVFKEKWNNYLKDMPTRVGQIIDGGQDLRAQADQIAELGAPALPYVVERAEAIDRGNGHAIVAALEKSLVEAKPATTVCEFAEKNADSIQKLKSYVEGHYVP